MYLLHFPFQSQPLLSLLAVPFLRNELIGGDNPDVRDIFSVIGRVASYRRPGSSLVDMFPALANFSLYDYLSSWRSKAQKMADADAEVWSRFWYSMKKQVENGTAPHSWGKAFMESNYEKYGIDELGAIYAGYLPLIQL